MALNAKQKRFLAAYAMTSTISHAATACQMNRSNHYGWMQQKEYKAAFEKEKERAVGLLEDEAIRRAHAGVEEPVYQGGKLVGTKLVYSDVLLIFLLKAARPEKYRDRFMGPAPDGAITIKVIHETVNKTNGSE